MKRILLILISFCWYVNTSAQIYLDKPIILSGTTSSDKQIENLSEPNSLQEITPSGTIQNNAGRFAIATGNGDSLELIIPSGLQFYSPGNTVYFQASFANTRSVSLSVNNLPFFPLVVYGTDSLKKGQLKAGQIYCAIFSGTEFQLLSPVNNDCKTGYVEINSTYCMEKDERAADNAWQAMVTCNSLNARLCKWGEWYYACQKTGTGLLNMTNGNWEWTDDAADAKIRIAGRISCVSMGASGITTGEVYPYRCCYSK